MKLDVNTFIQRNLSDCCVLEYLGTLYQLAYRFRCSGEEILQHNGFRSQAWVESLFMVAAKNHCFAGANCPNGLPFRAIQPLITGEIVAHFCLAGDLLETAFYEHLLFQQSQKLNSLAQTRANIEISKQLQLARQKFARQKAEFIKLAYGPKPAKKIINMYNVCLIAKDNKMQQEILLTLEVMPTVFQLYPRDENTPDMAPVRKLCRKYIRLFTICAESEALTDLYG